jgi:hypothetical protein
VLQFVHARATTAGKPRRSDVEHVQPVIAKKVAPNSGEGGTPSVVVKACTQCSGR